MAKKNKQDTKNIRTTATPTIPARQTTGEASAPPKTSQQELQVFIDYPLQDEGITSGEYTFRVGTQPAAEKVEISIDRGPWLSARQSDGYWWYDWSNFAEGVHRITARALSADGNSGISQQRRVQVLKK